jgi:hypothetical protein
MKSLFGASRAACALAASLVGDCEIVGFVMPAILILASIGQ